MYTRCQLSEATFWWCVLTIELPARTLDREFVCCVWLFHTPPSNTPQTSTGPVEPAGFDWLDVGGGSSGQEQS